MASKAPLLILNGALGSKGQCEELLQTCCQNFDCHYLEFAGHGTRSNELEEMKEFGIEVFSEQMRLFILDNQIEGTHVFGYSMGGYVALHLAQSHPMVLGNIICLGTKFEWNKDVADQEARKLNPEKIKEKVPFFAKYLERQHGNAWPQLVERTKDMMRELGNGQAMKKADFQQIKNPVLLIRGRDDDMVTEEESLKTARALGEGKFQELQNSAHPLEKVDFMRLQKAMENFYGLV